MRGAVQLQGIDEVGVDAPQDHVGPLQPGDGPHINLAVAGDQVVTLDQQEAQVTGQVRLFEIGLAERAGGQQADARVGAVGGRGQALAEPVEEGRQALDVHGVVEVRIGATKHQPVLQRIARAGGGLGAVVQHPPAAVRPPAQVCGVDLQIAAAGRCDPTQRRDEVRAAGHRGGRQVAVGDQRGVAIEVAQQGFHQVGALLDAGGDLRPFLFAEDQRQRVERPAALVLLAIDPVGDAGVADVPGGQVEAALELALGILGEIAQEAQPVAARPAGGVEQLVGDALDRGIAAQPAGQPLGRRGLQVRGAATLGGGLSGHPASSGQASSNPASSGTRPSVRRAAAGWGRGYDPAPRTAPCAWPAPRRN